MLYYDYYQSPHGRILLVADDQALTGVYFAGQKYHPRIAKVHTGRTIHCSVSTGHGLD